MKKIIALFAVVAFLGVTAAPSFAAVNYDKNPKATKTETKKAEKKTTHSCCSGTSSCKDKSSCSGSKTTPPKK